ncbi:hypothetical protein FJT64_021039 [Amphibalanus amphitrite]|uniref:Odorant receptor n=1 Tax=Amphibalanus amphitrite TaxID=1232801 RepID=A0A6A4WJV4_AMPAM|nr:hypothetical protein FJT64_021039 [Amphibalanus amphitrite]
MGTSTGHPQKDGRDPEHGRLTVATLAVGGWLTFSGVQWRTLPRHHCLLAALPVAVFALAAAGMLLFPIQADGVRRLLEAGAQYGFLVQSVTVLAVFVRRRKSLLRLESALTRLERRAGRPRPGWRRRLHVRLLLVWLLAAGALALWYCFLLVPARFHHPYYMVSMFVPELLHRPPAYWIVIAYQMVLIFFSCCLAVTFDSCCYIWMDAISFHLCAITELVSGAPADRRRRAVAADGTKPTPTTGPAERRVGVDGRWALPTERRRSQQEQNGLRRPAGDGDGLVRIEVSENLKTKSAQVPRDWPDGREEGPAEPTTDSVERTLELATLYYSDVRSFLESVNEVCGTSLFMAHAAAVSAILFAAYYVIGLIFSLSVRCNQLVMVQAVAVIVYVSLFLIRAILLSVDGSGIMERILSFVLTYIIILMQMGTLQGFDGDIAHSPEQNSGELDGTQ